MKLQKHRIAEVTFRNQNPELTYIIIQYHYVWIIRTLYIWLSRTLALPGPWFRHYVILNKTMNIVVLQMILFSLKSLHHCWEGVFLKIVGTPERMDSYVQYGCMDSYLQYGCMERFHFMFIFCTNFILWSLPEYSFHTWPGYSLVHLETPVTWLTEITAVYNAN